MNQTLAKVFYVAGVTTFCTFLGCWAVLAHQENTPSAQKPGAHRTNGPSDEKFMRDAAEGGVSEIDRPAAISKLRSNRDRRRVART